MHTDLASLLTNVAFILVGISAVGFLLWFLIVLTMEKNGKQIRCRMEFQLMDTSSAATPRRPIREVAAPRSCHEVLDLAPSVPPAQIAITHRVLHAAGQTEKNDLTDNPWQTRPFLFH